MIYYFKYDSFKNYLSNQNWLLCIFRKPGNPSNESLMEMLKVIEFQWADVPILCYEYDEFVSKPKYSYLNLQPDDFLLIDETDIPVHFPNPDCYQILELLYMVSIKRADGFISRNKTYKDNPTYPYNLTWLPSYRKNRSIQDRILLHKAKQTGIPKLYAHIFKTDIFPSKKKIIQSKTKRKGKTKNIDISDGSFTDTDSQKDSDTSSTSSEISTRKRLNKSQNLGIKSSKNLIEKKRNKTPQSTKSNFSLQHKKHKATSDASLSHSSTEAIQSCKTTTKKDQLHSSVKKPIHKGNIDSIQLSTSLAHQSGKTGQKVMGVSHSSSQLDLPRNKLPTPKGVQRLYYSKTLSLHPQSKETLKLFLSPDKSIPFRYIKKP